MRVLAVPQVRALGERERQAVGKGQEARCPLEVRGDCRVVRRHARERLGCQAQAQLLGQGPAALHRGDDLAVLGRVAQHRDARPVLGRGAQQRHAADVHLLDRLEHAGAAGCGLLEGVQRHGHEVNGRYAVPLDLGLVAGLVACQQPGVHGRVQCLDAASQHLGKPGHFLQRHDGQPGGAQRRGRSPGGDDLCPGRAQRACQRYQPGLVRDAEQRSTHPCHARPSCG